MQYSNSGSMQRIQGHRRWMSSPQTRSEHQRVTRQQQLRPSGVSDQTLAVLDTANLLQPGALRTGAGSTLRPQGLERLLMQSSSSPVHV
jgi:hypothetical protein